MSGWGMVQESPTSCIPFIAKNGCNGCNGRCNGHVPASQILLLFTDPTVVLLLLFNNSTLFSPQR